MASIRLGDLLVKAKVINDIQLNAALHEQQRWGGRLGELLVRMGFVTEEMLVKALSKQLSIVTVNLDAVPTIPPHVRARIPAEVARDLVALPLQLRDEGKTLVVVMAEPQNIAQVDTLRSVSRCRIVTQIAGRQSIARAFARFYDGVPVAEPVEKPRLIDLDEPPTAPGGRSPAEPGAARAGAASPDAAAAANRTAAESLRAIEEAQRREVAVLKGMVELLIEKGVFTREEYLAKVKRGA